MSAGIKVPHAVALEVATRLARQLAPVVERIKVVGSLRRMREQVGDIEFIAEPRMAPAADLLRQDWLPDIEAVHAVARSWGEVLKCGPRYVQILLPDGLKCDLFLAYAPSQWGSQYAIRTGPAELGKLVMTRLQEFGLKHVDGHVEDASGRVVPTPDEEAFFALAGLPCLPPELRDRPEARVPVERPAPAPAPHLLIVDGSNFAHRAYHAMRGRASISAVAEEFRRRLLDLVIREQPTDVAVALDAECSFRQSRIPGYKDDRKGRPGPRTPELTAALRPMLEACCVAVREGDDLEADDVIAAVVKGASEQGYRISIVSGDMDLLQLVDDARGVRVLRPRDARAGGGYVSIDEQGVQKLTAEHEDFGVPLRPDQLLALRVIAGGKDNLPRLEGPRTGKKPWGFTTRRAAALLAGGATLAEIFAGRGLNDRERSWLTPEAIASAGSRHLNLTLRCDATIVRRGSTDVAHLRLRSSSAAPARPSDVPEDVARMDSCCDCGRPIPYDPVFHPTDRCRGCAFVYGVRYAAEIRARGWRPGARRPLPTHAFPCARTDQILTINGDDGPVRPPMDAAPVLYLPPTRGPGSPADVSEYGPHRFYIKHVDDDPFGAVYEIVDRTTGQVLDTPLFPTAFGIVQQLNNIIPGQHASLQRFGLVAGEHQQEAA